MAELSVADHLARLVGFNTISEASNLGLVDWVEEFCRPYGVRIRRFPNQAGDKASLLVSVGPERPGGIVLSGHTDVVPTTGQDWLADPFVLRSSEGRLIGRGTTDMKGFLACCLAMLPAWARTDLQRPVHLAFSYDEEVGCTGVGPMAEWIGQSAMKPRLAIIGEPSSMQVINAHKGGLIGWATVTGKAGHSSQPDRYVNAVMIAAKLIAFIEDLRAEMRTGPFFETLDPPYSTIQVNTIQGGSHGNIVAAACRFFWEMRIIPGQGDHAVLNRIVDYARQELEPAMKAIDPSCGIAFDIQARIPALLPNADLGLQDGVMGLLGQTVPQAVSYGSEAGIFQEAGVPAIICGPGDIAQAHQPEEFIEQSQLDACVTFLESLTATLTDTEARAAE
ncbi:acetylornithine deacetylase [Mesorhizobium loti]|nr:acetylornithine deacetylase [Mesorhizobium loti]PLP56667.1 acetylornithine deacetylase [Mesorhizobium loti]